MNIQIIFVIILFAAALGYLIRMLYRSFQKSDKGCGGNCKCSADFSSKK